MSPANEIQVGASAPAFFPLGRSGCPSTHPPSLRALGAVQPKEG